MVAKKGSLAYDTSKAAANHLVRELAVELAPLVRVNGVAPGDGGAGQRHVPARPRHRVAGQVRDRLRRAEATEALRNKLAGFYADRTLRKRPITPADQAEAAFFLVSAAPARRPPAGSSRWTAGCRRRSSVRVVTLRKDSK